MISGGIFGLARMKFLRSDLTFAADRAAMHKGAGDCVPYALGCFTEFGGRFENRRLFEDIS